MEKKNKGLIIACSILGGFAAIFAFLAICTAFDAKFALDFEWWIVSDLAWATFDLLLWSLILMVVFVIAIVAILVISDDKQKRQSVRQRRKNKYFE